MTPDEVQSQVQPIRQGLQHAMFEDASLLKRLLPISSITLGAIRRSLGKKCTESSENNCNGYLPHRGELRHTYFRPLVELINAIGQLYLHRSHTSATHVRMLALDDLTPESHMYFHPHLPSLVAPTTNHHFRGNKLQYSSSHWVQVSFVAEVGDGWHDLVARSGMYAQAILDAHPTRTFALVVGVNHATLSARFLFFHRGGLHSTPEFDLANANAKGSAGFNGFIYGVVCATALQSGHCSWTLLPKTKRSPSASLTPGGPVPYRAIDYGYRRDTLTGKSTAGWLLERTPAEIRPPKLSDLTDINPNLPLNTELDPSRVTTRKFCPDGVTSEVSLKRVKANSGRRRAPAPPASLDDKRSVLPETNISPGDRNAVEMAAQNHALTLWHNISPLQWQDDEMLPGRVFIKDSWAPIDDGRPDEHEINQAMSGSFGAPKLLFTQLLDSNEFFYAAPKSTKDWHLFDETEHDHDEPEPFPRYPLVHFATYFATIGSRLSRARTPRELLTSILHAMLGELYGWWIRFHTAVDLIDLLV